MCDMCGPNRSDQVIDHSIKHPFELKPETDNECVICEQHVSAHPDKMEYLAKVQMEIIIKHGHQVRSVFPTNPDEGFGFAYSIGRTVKDRPELLVTGSLDPELQTYIINRVAELDGEGKVKAGQLLDEVLDGYQVKIVEVRDLEEAEMFGVTNNFGSSNPTALQIVWPDMEGRFPGEPDFEYGDKQPVFA